MSGGIAVVTGGASGLGAEIARVLAGEQYQVIVADVNAEAAGKIAAEIGGEARTVDLTDADACTALIDDLERLDVLVNNAGTDKTVSVDEMTQDEFDRVVAVNLRAPFALSKAAFGKMRQSGGGQIINIASTASKRAWSNASAYHASKWGLLGLSHALHVEGRAHGIKVTALLAGGMRTPFILDRFPDTPLENLQDPRTVAETIATLLKLPRETVIPELMVVPMTETSWP